MRSHRCAASSATGTCQSDICDRTAQPIVAATVATVFEYRRGHDSPGRNRTAAEPALPFRGLPADCQRPLKILVAGARNPLNLEFSWSAA